MDDAILLTSAQTRPTHSPSTSASPIDADALRKLSGAIPRACPSDRPDAMP